MRTIRLTAAWLTTAALLYGACVALLCWCCGELPDVPDMGPWHE